MLFKVIVLLLMLRTTITEFGVKQTTKERQTNPYQAVTISIKPNPHTGKRFLYLGFKHKMVQPKSQIQTHDKESFTYKETTLADKNNSYFCKQKQYKIYYRNPYRIQEHLPPKHNLNSIFNKQGISPNQTLTQNPKFELQN